jgi:S1-C subfamily serine protease
LLSGAIKSGRVVILIFFALGLAAGLARPHLLSAQNTVIRDGATAPGSTNNQPELPPNGSIAPGVPANPTLEIAPHVIAAPSPVANATPAPDADDVSDASGTLDDALHRKAASKQSAPAADDTPPGLNRPYIGISAQYVTTRDPAWHTVQGLEVVSVDHGGPADRAGIKGRGAMTSVGETGATASTMMAPLDLVVMPLLKKNGSLGSGGDLIVAIDDQRVKDSDALKDALDGAKPGDTLYLTIMRSTDGKNTTIKIPVKLANRQAKNSESDAANLIGGN